MEEPDPNTITGYSISVILSFILIGVLILPACTSRLDCATTKVICAGLVTDTGSIDDFGLNQGAWEGLQDALLEHTIHHAEYIESSELRDYIKNIEYFTDRDFDIILTVGMGQRLETQQAAENYPAVQFVGIDQTYNENMSNLHAILFQDAQMGYFAGAVAVMLTKTSLVGAVCESSEIDRIRQKCEGFRLGASSCGEMCQLRPDQTIEVLVRYREDEDPDLLFNDPEWAEKVTRELIHRGVDVLFAVGGGTGQGAIRAAADSEVYTIGTEKDQWFALPEARMSLLTSVYGDSRQAVRDWISASSSGRQPTRIEASFVYAPFHDLESAQSLGMVQMINRIIFYLDNGTIKVPNFP